MALFAQLAGSLYDDNDVLSGNERRWLEIEKLKKVHQHRLIYERLLVLFASSKASEGMPEHGFYSAALARFLRTARVDLIAAMWPNLKAKRIDVAHYSMRKGAWEASMKHLCSEIFRDFTQMVPPDKLIMLVHAGVLHLCAELYHEYADRLDSDDEEEEEEERVLSCSTCPKCKRARTVSKRRFKPKR